MNIITHDEGGLKFTTEVEGSHAQLDYTLAGTS